MHVLIALTTIWLAAPASAQDAAQSPEYQQMQQMMRQMNRPQQANDAMFHGMQRVQQMDGRGMRAALDMGRCMHEQVGEAGMARIEAEGKAFDEKVKALCAAGRRDEAAAEQREFARRMMQTKEYQGMQSCIEKHKDALQDPAWSSMKNRMEGANGVGKQHVCG